MKGANKILEGGKQVVSKLAEHRDGNKLIPTMEARGGWETENVRYLWRR